jgi:glycosyltransferase involved in cell wall biosynthesis
MHSPILVSIIVPIYQIEAYLPKCLTSIVGQTYPHLEIILVNDGSMDRCLEICESFAKEDARIVIINKENGGISSARNAGLDKAKGSYITFIDGDDFLHKDFISLSVASLLETKSQISVGNFHTIETREGKSFVSIKVVEKEVVFMPKEMLLNFYQFDNPYTFVTVNGKLYAEKLFQGLRFPLNEMFEDEFLNYLLVYRAEKIVFLTKQIYFYLLREGSESHKPFSLNDLTKLRVFEQRMVFFQNLKETTLENETLYAYLKLIISNSINLKIYFPEEVELFENLMIKYKQTYKKVLLSTLSISRKCYIFFLFPSLIRSNLFFKLRNLFLSFHVKFNRYFELKS